MGHIILLYLRLLAILENCQHKIRLNILKKQCRHLGNNVTVGLRFEIGYPENLYINDFVRIGNNALINANGGVTIDSGCVIGPNVTIFSVNHIYNQSEALPFANTNVLKPVHIERNCWIGANVFITPGVTIGEGSVIAGASVVIKDVPPLSVVGGNPAIVKKKVDKKLYDERVSANKYCDWIIAAK